METGRFDWSEIELPMTPEQDPADALTRALRTKGARRADVLLRLRATGWVTLSQRLALSQAVTEAEQEPLPDGPVADLPHVA